MKKFKWCVNRFFNAFGKTGVFLTVLVCLINILSQGQGSQETMLSFYTLVFNTMATLMVALIPGVILELIFFNCGPYESSLKIRRVAFTILWGVTAAVVFSISGILEFDSGMKFALYFIEMIVASFILGMTSFLVHDAKQKKKIAKINEKLNEFDGK